MSEFEWDLRKAASNLRKHGVAFAEGLTVFATPGPVSLTTPTTRSTSGVRSSLGTRDAPVCWSWASRNGEVVFASSPCDALRRLRRDVMKRTRRAQTDADELRAEYEFDYAKGRKNRFATSGAPTIAVVLEPDVARVFSSAAKVNRLLRSVIKAVPGTAVDRKRRAG